MSRDPSSLTLPFGTDVVTVSPLIGPTACTASPRAPSPCTASPVQPPTILFGTPLTVPMSKILFDIDALPSPPCSPAIVTTEPLVCTSSLTERALRAQLRNALRATHDVAAAPLPDTVHSDAPLAESNVPARILNSCLLLPFTPQRHAPVYDYRISATAPRVTTLVANHPPFFDRVYPPRDFSPLAPLRASRSVSSSSTSATPSPKPTTRTSAPKITTRTASTPPSAPGPILDLSPMPPTDLRASAGWGTGRTPGLRPTVPLPPAFLSTTDGPPPHLGYLAPIWASLEPAQQAKTERVSLHGVEEGLARARVSAQDIVKTASDRHAIELATAEHERLAAPLRARLITLHRHSATARSELQESAVALDESTRSHRECQTRVASIDAQTRSTAAALTTAERGHASFLSGLSAQQPAPPHSAAHAAPATQQPRPPVHLATSVASAARQPPASANLATLVVPSVPQPLALGASAVPTVAAAARPLGPTAPAATRSLIAPAVTFSARPTMPPPAPREPQEPSTSTPWSVVVSRSHRQPQHQLPSLPRDDAYLELPVSKLMFRNKCFPSALRVLIKEHASEVHEVLLQLTGKRCRLNRALDLATQNRTLHSDRVVNATLRLRDLLEAACGTPDGAQWLRETLREIAAKHRTDQTDSSASDSSTTTGQRRREEPSNGRGNAKWATFSGTSDSDSGLYPRRTGRDRRQVTPFIFHAAEHKDSNTPSFPPRMLRPRVTQRLPPRAPNSSMVNASGADPPPFLNQMVEAVTATAIAAVDRHLAHMGLCPAPVSPPAGPVGPTTHPEAVPTDTVLPFVSPTPVAPPPPSAGPVAPTTHLTAVPTDNAYPAVAPAPVSMLPPLADSAVPTAHPAPAPTRTPPPPTASFAPALHGPLTPPPPDERILYVDSSSLASNSSSFFSLGADFDASLQAAYRTLDMRRVPRVQPLQFPPSADRTVATQLLIRSMRDALSEIFDVADPTGAVTLASPVWIPGWHAPLLKLTKVAITPSGDDTHDLHRLVDDLFSQLQERMTSGSSGPEAFKTLLADFTDYFNRAPRGSALATLQNSSFVPERLLPATCELSGLWWPVL